MEFYLEISTQRSVTRGMKLIRMYIILSVFASFIYYINHVVFYFLFAVLPTHLYYN